MKVSILLIQSAKGLLKCKVECDDTDDDVENGLNYSIKQGSVLMTNNKKSLEDFFIEEYDDLPQIKNLDHDYNSDYEIELTQEELSNRVHTEKDPLIKDLCIYLSNIRHKTN